MRPFPSSRKWPGVARFSERWLYSYFVTVTKVIFAVAALSLLVVLITLVSSRPDPTGGVLQPGGRGMPVLINAVQKGVDARGYPYTITSQRTWRPNADNQAIDLVRPVADISTANGNWITIRADRGRYNEETGKLILLGNVRVNHDQGHEFLTDEVLYRTGDGVGWGDRPVVAQGGLGVIRATGFRMFGSGETIVFLGPTRAELVPGESANGGR